MARGNLYGVLTLATSPPGSPALLDAHFVNGVGSAGWTGKDNTQAVWNGAAWLHRAPSLGDSYLCAADGVLYSWDGSALVTQGGGGGSGDVVGPASSTDRHIPTFDGTTGKLLEDSGVSMDDVFTAVGQAAQATTDIDAGTGAGVLTPSQITSNQNDYAPTGHGSVAQFRLSTDAARDVTGLAGGATARLVTIHNVGSFDLTLKDESGSSTAANRFALGADLRLKPDHAIALRYDATSSRWRAVKCMTPEAYGGTGRTRVPDPFTLEFYASTALAAGSSLRGILNSTDTGSAFEVPSGKTLKVLRAIGSVKNGATAGTYNDDLILRNVTDSTDTQVATNTGTAAAEVYIHAEGTLDSPLATLAAGKRFAAGVRNRSGNPGAWDASYKHHVALVCVLE